MRRTRHDWGFVALKIEGGILPAEFVQKVVALEAKGQSGRDYGLPKGTTVKDEIGRAWRIASAEWKEYQENRLRKDADQKKLGVDGWLTVLLRIVLGHDDLEGQTGIRIGERFFPVSHKSVRGAVPVVLTTHENKLEKSNSLFGDEGRKRSPHALMQEFLNAEEGCLWGLVSNGLQLRLLRDNPSLTRPAYIEADLERIFEEQLYADFAAVWLIFHSSRFRGSDNNPRLCILEQWREEGHETGERALRNLRDGVTVALKHLGSGFLQHAENERLRASLTAGELSSLEYFRELLRLVYRLLFLFTVEERELLHDDETEADAKRLYRDGYALSKLRSRALLRRNYDKHVDLWEGLRISFACLARGNRVIGLPALGGLFSKDQCPYIDGSLIENHYLLSAIHALSFFRNGDILARVNYRDMDTEELGSVYESLLELHPYIDVEKSPWGFSFVGEEESSRAKGSERKLTGSYYTPASLVDQLIKTALEPVIDRTKKEHKSSPRDALLSLKVVDPACGSGHFLLAAARRLATEIASLDSIGDASEEEVRRHALREVVRHCIYGVDKNPLAVELCKTALWIETMETEKPLSFLDSHIRCGDSLIGILRASDIQGGIPDEAFTALSGDDEKIVKELKRRNKAANAGAIQGNIFSPGNLNSVRSQRSSFETMPEDTIEEIEAKKLAWSSAQSDVAIVEEEFKANIFVGAFFSTKTSETLNEVPTSEDLARLASGMGPRKGIAEGVKRLADRHGFFHWYIAFPEVFARGGFDVVLGNPPWEHTELKEKEWFAVRRPDIANALTGANRKKMIDALAKEEPRLYQEFIEELRTTEAVSLFVRHSGRFPLCGRGRINTYAIFAETKKNLVSNTGFVGCIVPTGIATDDTTKFFFQDITRSGKLVSLYDFENAKGIFPGVHRSYKFCLLTLGEAVEGRTADFVFFAHDASELNDENRHFTMSADDLELLNPNTGTCGIFRYKYDAELTKSIYRRIPVLIREGASDGNPWSISFKQGLFNMTSDSEYFKTRQQLEELGGMLVGNVFEIPSDGVCNGDRKSERYLPLYEAKMLHHFDHRWATYEGLETRDLSDSEKDDAELKVIPRYWVVSNTVTERLSDRWKHEWLLGWRDICRNTDERTVISAIIPKVGVGNKIPLILAENGSAREKACLCANLSALVLDYVARQKLGGTTLNYFYLKQLPVLPPDRYSECCDWDSSVTFAEWISRYVVELVFTNWELEEFARECGYDGKPFKWNTGRRRRIRHELDAAFFNLYGIKRAEVENVLDTFPIVRRKDEDQAGEYISKRLILERFDAMSEACRNSKKYQPAVEPAF